LFNTIIKEQVRRREQNRRAQQNFRARKDAHTRELEERLAKAESALKEKTLTSTLDQKIRLEAELEEKNKMIAALKTEIPILRTKLAEATMEERNAWLAKRRDYESRWDQWANNLESENQRLRGMNSLRKSFHSA
jgi:hypothetical protein